MNANAREAMGHHASSPPDRVNARSTRRLVLTSEVGLAPGSAYSHSIVPGGLLVMS